MPGGPQPIAIGSSLLRKRRDASQLIELLLNSFENGSNGSLDLRKALNSLKNEYFSSKILVSDLFLGKEFNDSSLSQFQESKSNGILLEGEEKAIFLDEYLFGHAFCCSEILKLSEKNALETVLQSISELENFPGLNEGILALYLYFESLKLLSESLKKLCFMFQKSLVNEESESGYYCKVLVSKLISVDIIPIILKLLQNLDTKDLEKRFDRFEAVSETYYHKQIVMDILKTKNNLSEILFAILSQKSLPVELLQNVCKFLQTEPFDETDDLNYANNCRILCGFCNSFEVSSLSPDEIIENLDKERFEFLFSNFDENKKSIWKNKSALALCQLIFAISLVNVLALRCEIPDYIDINMQECEFYFEASLVGGVFGFLASFLEKIDLLSSGTESFISSLIENIFDKFSLKLKEIMTVFDENTDPDIISTEKTSINPSQQIYEIFVSFINFISAFSKSSSQKNIFWQSISCSTQSEILKRNNFLKNFILKINYSNLECLKNLILATVENEAQAEVCFHLIFGNFGHFEEQFKNYNLNPIFSMQNIQRVVQTYIEEIVHQDSILELNSSNQTTPFFVQTISPREAQALANTFIMLSHLAEKSIQVVKCLIFGDRKIVECLAKLVSCSISISLKSAIFTLLSSLLIYESLSAAIYIKLDFLNDLNSCSKLEANLYKEISLFANNKESNIMLCSVLKFLNSFFKSIGKKENFQKDSIVSVEKLFLLIKQVVFDNISEKNTKFDPFKETESSVVLEFFNLHKEFVDFVCKENIIVHNSYCSELVTDEKYLQKELSLIFYVVKLKSDTLCQHGDISKNISSEITKAALELLLLHLNIDQIKLNSNTSIHKNTTKNLGLQKTKAHLLKIVNSTLSNLLLNLLKIIPFYFLEPEIVCLSLKVLSNLLESCANFEKCFENVLVSEPQISEQLLRSFASISKLVAGESSCIENLQKQILNFVLLSSRKKCRILLTLLFGKFGKKNMNHLSYPSFLVQKMIFLFKNIRSYKISSLDCASLQILFSIMENNHFALKFIKELHFGFNFFNLAIESLFQIFSRTAEKSMFELLFMDYLFKMISKFLLAFQNFNSKSQLLQIVLTFWQIAPENSSELFVKDQKSFLTSKNQIFSYFFSEIIQMVKHYTHLDENTLLKNDNSQDKIRSSSKEIFFDCQILFSQDESNRIVYFNSFLKSFEICFKILYDWRVLIHLDANLVFEIYAETLERLSSLIHSELLFRKFGNLITSLYSSIAMNLSIYLKKTSEVLQKKFQIHSLKNFDKFNPAILARIVKNPQKNCSKSILKSILALSMSGVSSPDLTDSSFIFELVRILQNIISNCSISTESFSINLLKCIFFSNLFQNQELELKFTFNQIFNENALHIRRDFSSQNFSSEMLTTMITDRVQLALLINSHYPTKFDLRKYCFDLTKIKSFDEIFHNTVFILLHHLNFENQSDLDRYFTQNSFPLQMKLVILAKFLKSELQKKHLSSNNSKMNVPDHEINTIKDYKNIFFENLSCFIQELTFDSKELLKFTNLSAIQTCLGLLIFLSQNFLKNSMKIPFFNAQSLLQNHLISLQTQITDNLEVGSLNLSESCKVLLILVGSQLKVLIDFIEIEKSLNMPVKNIQTSPFVDLIAKLF